MTTVGGRHRTLYKGSCPLAPCESVVSYSARREVNKPCDISQDSEEKGAEAEDRNSGLCMWTRQMCRWQQPADCELPTAWEISLVGCTHCAVVSTMVTPESSHRNRYRRWNTHDSDRATLHQASRFRYNLTRRRSVTTCKVAKQSLTQAGEDEGEEIACPHSEVTMAERKSPSTN